VAPAVLAVFLQIHQLTLHDALKGATFTADGTNLGSALLLSSGRLPYDNFVLAQPPGMSILMLPFAWGAHAASTNGALSGARILTAIVAVLNVLLVGLVTRHRGFAGSILAGVAFALYPFAFHATASALLEPYLLFFCLLGLVLAFPNGELADGGRLIVAGAVLGFAITIKPWAVIPAVAVLICASVRWRSCLKRFAGGLLGGVIVPFLFFLVAAPGAFWHDVVVAELRSSATGKAASGGARLAQLFGLGAPIGIANGRLAAIAIVIVLGAGALILTIARLKLSLTLDWVIIGTAGALIAVAFIPSSVPLGYGYFVAGFVAVVAGMIVGNLLSLISALRLGEGVSVTAAAGGSVLCVAIAVGLIALAVPKETRYERTWFLHNGINPALAVDRVVPTGVCALSDDPSVLIVADRLLGQPSGCPDVVDPAGVARAAGSGVHERAALTATWEQWMNESPFVLLNTRTGGIPWTPALRAYFRRHFALASRGTVDIYTAKSSALP
jgi:hypothetical protein